MTCYRGKVARRALKIIAALPRKEQRYIRAIIELLTDTTAGSSQLGDDP